MVITCSVVGCSNRHERGKDCSFYYIPKVIDHQGEKAKELSTRCRSAWLASINRSDWTLGPGARVCSVHFISSEPASLFDEQTQTGFLQLTWDTKSMKAETVMLIVTVTIVGSEGDLVLSILRHFTIVIKVVIIIVIMMIQKSLVLHARLRRQVT